jgi:TusA-related sulfurtransferase
MALDLRTTKCPLNFVKARLAAEKLQPGEVLEIWVASDGESALNIPNSLRQEGYEVTLHDNDDGVSVVRVSKKTVETT